MTQADHILIVEDEVVLADLIKEYLEHSGFAVTMLHEGSHAVETILELSPDLVVLDLMLPGKDGLAIAREVRDQSDVPIIMETAKLEEIDRLLGLELGADDYLCKPFSPRELVARVKAVLRRTKVRSLEQSLPQHGLTFDEDKWTACLEGHALDLTRREFQLLRILSNHPGRVYSRAQLLDLVFSDNLDMVDRTIDSHIKNIRIKVKAIAPGMDLIRSIYGIGYAFGD
ncbi:response regulator [Cohaesibacter celericrescens]|uniref:Two-component system response regulator BaeR n=1 Tax=Cohaesibacter celericrescens TaxID=2067669 RepID=A0A2N5XQS2_9HYPH|nr:response regulator [Cohaesibacter celericrescens]PLW76871.1 two-component system response regulator BaeR [Cohaesibacter celericrescens]